jgi:hypothetical protein
MQAGAAGLKTGPVPFDISEGTRSIDGHVAEFKKGAAILAVELGCRIVPIGIRGSFEAWPRGGGFRLHPIEFHFGDPIDPKGFAGSADPYSALTEKLRKDAKALGAIRIPDDCWSTCCNLIDRSTVKAFEQAPGFSQNLSYGTKIRPARLPG